MLRIGLTGGIASGKSLVAARLLELGAVLIDADVLAREAVAAGTPGLDRLVQTFGAKVLGPDGTLDRPSLAALVFGQPEELARLNAVVHPLVRRRAAELMDQAPADAIVVQDIPLLVETGQGASFQLVLVVDAPEAERIRRMVRHRGMARRDAAARIRAQASDAERYAAADVIIDNSADPEAALSQVDQLWAQRLALFSQNLLAGRAATRTGPAVLAPADPHWPLQAARLAARIRAAAPEDIVAVDHIGSTAVPGLDAMDVLDLQVRVRTLADADRIVPELTRSGFPPLPGQRLDQPKACDPDPAHWHKRLHASADPGRAANVHIRVQDSPGARYALAFRDWLRAEAAVRDAYLTEKRRAARAYASDPDTAGYALGKEAWIAGVAEPGLRRWIRATGWTSP
ncbi:dephospho-CoA kinase [Paenarthrobacter sp. Z7-10]|uniref:dephospho-CoA kinase n=1 Tax=Paenarthrobacter sp. Z7-10 TaxID=2787635 RepID=UPI0022A952B7|nr:dephospho-CoA kinase [Paenarthrobacter sp. Z7-10]MCZ2404877.1 dephospho-CoA kinase [Paenarthrobacter sp. Z7-10]